MKRLFSGLLVATALAGIAADALARGHGGGFRGGHGGGHGGGYRGGYGVRYGGYIAAPLIVGVGAAAYYGNAYGYGYGVPYYYGNYPYGYGYPPGVVTAPTPPAYFEQAPSVVAPPPAQSVAPTAYWFYCAQSQGYYPYVRECPGGWQPVTPQPRR